jgi:hypothetical protein
MNEHAMVGYSRNYAKYSRSTKYILVMSSGIAFSSPLVYVLPKVVQCTNPKDKDSTEAKCQPETGENQSCEHLGTNFEKPDVRTRYQPSQSR